jgi:hypothetical protein
MKQSILVFLALLSNCFAMDPYLEPISMTNKTELCTAAINLTITNIENDFNLTQIDRNIWCYKYLKQKTELAFDKEKLSAIKNRFKISDLSDLVGTWEVNNGSIVEKELVTERGETFVITDDVNVPIVYLGKYHEVGESIMFEPASLRQDVEFLRLTKNFDEQFVLYNPKTKVRFVFEKKLN